MMKINFTPFTVLWAVLAAVVLALIAYRKTVTSHEDETIHLGAGSENAPAQQMAIAHKLEAIDKWGKLLTIITVLYGLLLVCLYTYQTWLGPGATVGM
jgi:hypothetical protein